MRCKSGRRSWPPRWRSSQCSTFALAQAPPAQAPHRRDLQLQGRRPRCAPARAREAGRHRHRLHLAGADRGRAAGGAFEKKTGVKVNMWRARQRQRGAARDVRGARQAPCRRRGRDQRARDGIAGARTGAGRVLQPLPRRPAGRDHPQARPVGARPAELLRRRLQPEQGEGERPAQDLRGFPRPQVEGPHRAGSHRRRVDGRRREDLGRSARHGLHAQAGRDQARHAQGPCAAGAADLRRARWRWA